MISHVSRSYHISVAETSLPCIFRSELKKESFRSSATSLPARLRRSTRFENLIKSSLGSSTCRELILLPRSILNPLIPSSELMTRRSFSLPSPSPDRVKTEAALRDAVSQGMNAIYVTVDTPVLGKRVQDRQFQLERDPVNLLL